VLNVLLVYLSGRSAAKAAYPIQTELQLLSERPDVRIFDHRQMIAGHDVDFEPFTG
jgi:hypothetical protein